MKLGLIVAICLLGCFSYFAVFGCMYTVRDVGFVDIGSIPYRLYYYYIREDTPQNFISTFKQISYAALMDSNVEFEIINIEQQKDHPAMEYLHFWEIKSLPAAILVSPKGRSLVLPISAGRDLRNSSLENVPFKEMVWDALESIVASQKIKEISRHIVKAYCVVLLIQGKDSAENKKAQKAVLGAIEEITKIMSQMPKLIEVPPRLIVIPPELFSQERILLWSLGVNEYASSGRVQLSEPYVAVLYGRGRRIGPLLNGEKITENAVFNILSIIGSACECGLDRGWMLGMMIPIRWGKKVQSEVVKLLGFDAESPMVKTEVSQILSMSQPSGMESEIPLETAEGKLYEYNEESLKFENGATVAVISPAQLRELTSSKPTSSGTGSTFRMALFIVSGMVLLIIAGGIFIMLRARKRVS